MPEYMTEKEVKELASTAAAEELQKRIKPGFEDIDPTEMKDAIKRSKEDSEYVNGLKNDMAELKKNMGHVAGSLTAMKELQAEARAQSGKATREDAEIFKNVLEASAPASFIGGDRKSRAADCLKANFNNITTSSEGGYTVPTSVGRQMLSIALARSIALQDARIEPMALGQGQLNVPLDLEGGSVSYPGEGTAANASEFVVGIASLVPKRRIAKMICTRELLDMSAIDIMGHITNRLGILFANDTDTQAFAGTGTPMTGLRGAATLIPKVIASAGGGFGITAAEIKEGLGLMDDVSTDNLKAYLTWSVYWSKITTLVNSSANEVVGISDGASVNARKLLGFDLRFLSTGAGYSNASTGVSRVFMHLVDLQKALILSNFGVTRMSVSEEATVKDSAGTAVNLWDQGLFATKMEGYFTGICPDFYTTLVKAPGVNYTSAAA